jgi:hypothetical protein
MRNFTFIFLAAILLTACSSPVSLKTADMTPPPKSSAIQQDSTPIPAALVPTLDEQADTYRIRINPDLPPFDFKLIANPSPQRLIDGSNLVGWIEVSQEGNTLDRLPVTFRDGTQNLSWPQFGLRALDINFDGYLDIASVENGGAEWGFFHWYEYDAENKQFFVSSLADELSAIPNNGVAVDPPKHEVYVYSLVAACASTYIYANAQGHLVLIKKRIYKQSDQGCVQVP